MPNPITAGGGKGYNLHVHTIGGGKGYTLHGIRVSPVPLVTDYSANADQRCMQLQILHATLQAEPYLYVQRFVPW
jgi:hypothetical protein